MSIASEDDAVEWHPAALFRGRTANPAGSFALIVLNQPLQHPGLIRRLWKNASMHVAADGGANCLYDARDEQQSGALFDDLQVIIGDLDSLRNEVRAHFETPPRRAVVLHDPDQYSTDFGKAVRHVRGAGALAGAGSESKSEFAPVDIVAVGGLGGRVDQGLSQLHHLFLFQKAPGYSDGRMFLVSGESVTFLLKAGQHRIWVRGDSDGEEEVFAKYVGIVPVREPSVISTRGLEWDVSDWATEFGEQVSTSNHVLPETQVVEVRTTKDVLFTIALREME